MPDDDFDTKSNTRRGLSTASPSRADTWRRRSTSRSTSSRRRRSRTVPFLDDAIAALGRGALRETREVLMFSLYVFTEHDDHER